MQENIVNIPTTGECPDHLDLVPEYECEVCWDRGCNICTVVDPTTGALISIKQFDREVYEDEIDDLLV